MAIAVADVETAPVSISLFTTHPGMGGKNLSLYTPYRTLFCHQSPSREDMTRSIPHDLGDLALFTHPRPGLDPASTYHQSVGRKGRRGIGLEVFSPSHPLRHHGVRGWPAIPGARRYSHLYKDRQNFTSRLPRCPGLLLPYKRAGQGSTRREGRSKMQARSQAQIGKGIQPTDQHVKQSPLYSHFSFET
jgi:hypothetical protein